MSTPAARPASIVIVMPGKPASFVVELEPENALIVAALAKLPPGAFRAVAGRLSAWKVPIGGFSLEAQNALLALYARIQEVFSE